MRLIRILILEDDLKTLAVLLDRIHRLEEKLVNSEDKKDIAVTVLSEYTQVEQYINPNKEHRFDVVLLDRDCKAGGSFHILNMEKIGLDKIVAISSIPPYNEEARILGVTRIVDKDYNGLDDFADKVIEQIEEIIR